MRLERLWWTKTGIILMCTALLFGPASAQESPNRYSEATAFTLSVAGMLIPVAAGIVLWESQEPGGTHGNPALLMASGFVFGPALGYGYSGQGGRAMAGVGLRIGFFLVSWLPAYAICQVGCSDGTTDLQWLVVATGAGLGAVSAIWDVARVRQSVRKKNLEHRAALISLAPVWVPATKSPGVGISVRF